MSQILLSLLISAVIVVLALWRGWLSQSGAAAALVVGTLIMGLGGWLWGVLLGVFFVSSSLLSKFKSAEKQATAAEKFDKGHTRDMWQVFANGGLGALIAILHAMMPSPFWFFAFIGVMATVNADTWATELGTLSKSEPRLITNGRVVERGTSGGVTLLGTGVSIAGGVLIGLLAVLWLQTDGVAYLLLGALGGLSGSLFDSFLGATVQVMYWDDVRDKETEKRVKYGRELQHYRGWSWMSNDIVNLLASVVGGGVAIVTALLLGLS